MNLIGREIEIAGLLMQQYSLNQIAEEQEREKNSGGA
jgi:DNA-binding CsgD family transcriptional regulator